MHYMYTNDIIYYAELTIIICISMTVFNNY